MESIEKIIKEIEVGIYFDSHYVISRLIHDFSDDYLRLAQTTSTESANLTLRVHQQIGNLISKLRGSLVERQDAQSISMNIHGGASCCALWKRI